MRKGFDGLAAAVQERMPYEKDDFPEVMIATSGRYFMDLLTNFAGPTFADRLREGVGQDSSYRRACHLG
jgi:hypothetical protein